jgi:hypothetical protein
MSAFRGLAMPTRPVFHLIIAAVTVLTILTFSINWSAGRVRSIDSPHQNTDAVLYVHYEGSAPGPRNLKYFVDHALHLKADFYFIINGFETEQVFPTAPNIHVVRRENTCYDLGSMGSVLRQNNSAISKKYKRFILTNSSIRGPFFPAWARLLRKACWSDTLFSLLRDNVKLVGLTSNCNPGLPQHLQSMMLATDSLGLQAMLPALQCYTDKEDAIHHGELALTQRVRDAGYDAMPLYSGYYAGQSPLTPKEFWATCKHGDIFFPGAMAGGMDVHPFDTMFVKTMRLDQGIDPLSPVNMAAIHQLTAWADESNFTSYDQC